MKNFCEAVKIFVIGLIFSSMMIFSENCSAALDYYSVDVTYLKDIIGNWYDSNGNLVFSISKDYKLNGCQMMSVGMVGDAGGAGYKIVYKDGGQNKYIEVWLTGSEAIEHDILLMNGLNSNNYALRRTKNPQYFESVGGIYLGMNQNEVLKLYGEPSAKEHFDRFFSDWIWKYNNLGLEVSVYGGIVTSITIYSYGDRKFDLSGLSAKNSKSDFEYKYNSSFSRRGNLNIGHGELINFYNGTVSLRILTLGSVF